MRYLKGVKNTFLIKPAGKRKVVRWLSGIFWVDLLEIDPYPKNHRIKGLYIFNNIVNLEEIK